MYMSLVMFYSKKKSHQRLGEVVSDIRCITNDFLPLVILPLVKLVFVVVTVGIITFGVARYALTISLSV